MDPNTDTKESSVEDSDVGVLTNKRVPMASSTKPNTTNDQLKNDNEETGSQLSSTKFVTKETQESIIIGTEKRQDVIDIVVENGERDEIDNKPIDETESNKASELLPVSSGKVRMNHSHTSDISTHDSQPVTKTAANIESLPSSILPTEPLPSKLTEIIVIDTNSELCKTDDKAVDSAYREKQDESSDSSSDSEDSVTFMQEEKCIVIDSDEENKAKGKKDSDLRTKGEVYPEELPPLDELVITVDPNVELVHTGSITGVVGCLVIVKANQNIPPLNENTILFLEGRVVLGQIFEVFGPVGSPWYSVRFNSTKDIEKKSISSGQKVYCAPKVEKLTNYVFVEHLRQMKGSDASWEDNNEPPAKYIDYSDDEEERRAKAKARNRGNEEEGLQLPGARKIRRRRQKDRQTFEPETEETNSGAGERKSGNFAHTHQGEYRNNKAGRGRNFNQRGGRHQGQPRMEYQSFQPFGAPPRFPQMSENQNSPTVYENGGPVRPSVFQPSVPQVWNNPSQYQTNWNPNNYSTIATTQSTSFQISGQNPTNETLQSGGQYYPNLSGRFPNMSLPPPPHCFGQPPPVFNRPMLTDQRYIQNPAFQQLPGPQFDPNVPPPNFNVG
ncbi:H/ACA ribonucleoprotein complex non-core subunit NAF1-like [Saccostrea echinata]|uniref:H/ACA ribonucleoprotein complex non-core subunit NAF1-like n=1 Tax=Saccostrea echinata TaxID=191078 RepID=UPI002A7EF79C|nr:H/ACA ribonucleoprotein complex non-core subunit NAF1-like [Saccostrea echinata]